jgi:hypothetical protein
MPHIAQMIHPCLLPFETGVYQTMTLCLWIVATITFATFFVQTRLHYSPPRGLRIALVTDAGWAVVLGGYYLFYRQQGFNAVSIPCDPFPSSLPAMPPSAYTTTLIWQEAAFAVTMVLSLVLITSAIIAGARKSRVRVR